MLKLFLWIQTRERHVKFIFIRINLHFSGELSIWNLKPYIVCKIQQNAIHCDIIFTQFLLVSTVYSLNTIQIRMLCRYLYETIRIVYRGHLIRFDTTMDSQIAQFAFNNWFCVLKNKWSCEGHYFLIISISKPIFCSQLVDFKLLESIAYKRCTNSAPYFSFSLCG